MPILDPPTELLADESPDRPRWRATLDVRGWRALGAIVLVLLLVAGWTWWQGRPREVVLAAPTPAASDAPIDAQGVALGGEVVVHVVGAVRHPGLVHLPNGSRVADAIDAAGGAPSAQALSTVNLARLVVDGEQIDVGATRGSADAGVGINSATAAEFEALPGIGPVLAQRITAWRDAHGPFRSVDDLGDVPGIGDAVLGQLRGVVHL